MPHTVCGQANKASQAHTTSESRPAPQSAGGTEAVMDDWSSAKLGDVANLVLSVILFFSPWLFGLSAGAQWQTASIIGIFIAVSSIAALAAFAVWEEWVNLGAGLTLIVSPWLLGFQDSSAMAIDAVIGAMVALLAAIGVWLAAAAASQVKASLDRSDLVPPL